MHASLKAAFAAFVAAAFCAFAPGPASAQGRDNTYTVAGINVDQTGASAEAAQQAAFLQGERDGFERLVRRLAVSDELVARGMPAVDGTALEALVQSVDIEAGNRSSTTRFIGRLTVRFDATGVRTLLRQRGLTVVDTRAAPVLVAPLSAAGTPDDTAALWREVWRNGGFQDELVPLAIAPPELGGQPSWDSASGFAQRSAAASALYAVLRVQGATVSASLTEVDATSTRDRGAVSAAVQGTDQNAMRVALSALAEQASQRLQNDWKARVAVGGGQRARISASALYTDQRQWESIKTALQGAAQTLISEIRIEAVGRDGALVSFVFVGDRNQLVAELARRGVTLQDTPTGPTLRVSGQN